MSSLNNVKFPTILFVYISSSLPHPLIWARCKEWTEMTRAGFWCFVYSLKWKYSNINKPRLCLGYYLHRLVRWFPSKQFLFSRSKIKPEAANIYFPWYESGNAREIALARLNIRGKKNLPLNFHATFVITLTKNVNYIDTISGKQTLNNFI